MYFAFSNSTRFVWLVAVMAGLLTGCGGSDKWVKDRETVYPVSGTITFEGEPVEGAVVMFKSATKPLTAQALTRADGTYELRTYEDGDGAVSGEHIVSVRKTEKVANPRVEDDDSDSGATSRLNDLLPMEYANHATSTLKATVKEEENTDVNFDI